MTEPLLPATCALALEAILADPLEPGADAEAHMQICRACSEARVAFLAQEEAPDPLVPAGYYDRLPERVLRKLPARPGLRHRARPLAWTAAAAVLMAVGAGAFWAGRANRTPYVEATVRPAEAVETSLAVTDTPFHDGEEDASQIQALTPEEMKALLKKLDTPPSTPR